MLIGETSIDNQFTDMMDGRRRSSVIDLSSTNEETIEDAKDMLGRSIPLHHETFASPVSSPLVSTWIETFGGHQMKAVITVTGLAFALIASPVLAVEGQPAAPSGAPKAAAESGSSEAGKAASKNEMKSNTERKKSQDKAGDPHKM